MYSGDFARETTFCAGKKTFARLKAVALIFVARWMVTRHRAVLQQLSRLQPLGKEKKTVNIPYTLSQIDYVSISQALTENEILVVGLEVERLTRLLL